MQKGGKKIILGLLVFVFIIIFPILYNQGKANAGPDINLDTPEIAKLADKECIEPTEYMRANHMQLLLQWRDAAVREGATVYVNSQGDSFEISLEDTCLKCHSDNTASKGNSSTNSQSTNSISNPANALAASVTSSPNQFCFSCHDYAAVEPNCWSCHSDPRGAQK